MLRKFLFRSILVGCCLAVFQACDSGGGSDPVAPAPGDSTGQNKGGGDTLVHAPPDSSLPGSKATMIDTASFGVPAIDSVGATGAAWFRVEAQADSVYSISGTGLPGSKGVGKTDIKITVLSQSVDQVLGSVDDVGASRDPFVVVRAPASGYLRVKVEVGKSAATGFFNLTVRRMDRWEPNDSRAEAGHLAVDSLPVRAILEPSGSDWFAIPTRVGGFYRVAASSRNAWVTFRGAGGDSVPLATSADDSSYGIVFQAKEPVSFVEVNPSESAPVGETYALYCQKLPTDTLEDDGTFSSARSITVDNVPQTHFIAEYDFDVIKIPIRAGYVYRSQITSNVPLTAAMFQDTAEAGWPISVPASHGTAGYMGLTAATADGFMYLTVSSLLRGTYKVQETEYPGDSHEPDAQTKSVLLETGGAPVARFLMNNDLDWFSFQAEKGKRYWLNVSNPEKMRLSTTAYSPEQAPIALDPTDGSFRCQVSGTYHFSLGSGYSTGPYSVSLGSETVGYLPTDGSGSARTLSETVQWLDLHLDNTREYRFEFTAKSGSATIALCGMDSVLAKPGLSLASSGSPVSTVFRPSVSSDFRLKVSRPTGSGALDYSLSIGIELTDSLEPDDSPAAARPIATDSTIQNHAVNYGDTDWVSIKTEIGKIYEVHVNSPGAVRFGAYDPQGRALYAGSRAQASDVVWSFRAADTVSYGKFTLSPIMSTTSKVPYAVAVTKYLDDSMESDHSYAMATVLATDSTVQTHLIDPTDVDIVKFSVLKGRIYTVAIQSSVTVTGILSAYDTAATATKLVSTSTSSLSKLSFEPPVDGTIYLRMFSGSSAGVVKVAVDQSGFDSLESDEGELSKSVKIEAGTGAISRYLSKSDIDWFQLAADSGRYYTFQLSPSDVTTPSFGVLLADSTRLSNLLVNNSTASKVSFACTRSGTYYIYLYSSDTGAYSAVLSSTDTSNWTDMYEPDNQQNAASVLATDGRPAKHVMTYTDEDWTRIDVDSGVAYLVQLVNTGAQTESYILYTENQRTISYGSLYTKGSTYGDTTTIFYPAPKTTSIYLRVTGDHSGSYMVKAFKAPVDSFESDNIFSRASLIPTDSTIQPHLLCYGDTDWVKFSVDSGASYTVDIANQSENQLALLLYDSQNTSLTRAFSYSVNPSVTTLKATKNDTYYARIMPYSNTVATPYRYDLTVIRR